MKKTIIVCEALGHYWGGVRYFLESLGYNVVPMDQAESKERDSGYLNFESLQGLDPSLYAVLVTGDNSLRNVLKLEGIPNPIYTYINDYTTFMDKLVSRKNLPPENEVIKYPYTIPLDFTVNDEWIIKPVVGKGSLPECNRNCYKVTEPQFAVQYIKHDQAQVCLARFVEGHLEEIVFYTGKPEEPWSVAKPNDFVKDEELKPETIKEYVTKFMEILGKTYEIDGVIDAEFMLHGHKLYYAESNPRINGQSYFVAQPMLVRFIKQRLRREFWTEELEAAYKN